MAAIRRTNIDFVPMRTEVIHKSRIGLEILTPIAIILGTVTTIMIVNMIWIGLAICGLVILFVTNIYTGTYYK